MKVYCVIGYYDMDDGMKKGSELHGCYTKLEDAKDKMKELIRILTNNFASQHSDYFIKSEQDNEWSIFGGIDMATLQISEAIVQ